MEFLIVLSCAGKVEGVRESEEGGGFLQFYALLHSMYDFITT